MTYENVRLYSHATPSYDPDDNKEEVEGFNPDIDANNPDNFKDCPDEEIITSLH